MTHLLNVVFDQHPLHKLGQVQGGVVICNATDRHFLVFGEVLHIELQFGLMQRSDGARHHLISVEKLSDQASCFPDYRAAYSLSLPVQILTRTDNELFPVQLMLSKPGSWRVLTSSKRGRPSEW